MVSFIIDQIETDDIMIIWTIKSNLMLKSNVILIN